MLYVIGDRGRSCDSNESHGWCSMQGGCVFARVGPVVALANAIPARAKSRQSRCRCEVAYRGFPTESPASLSLVRSLASSRPKRQSQCKNRRLHYTAPVDGGLQIRPGHQYFPTLELPSIAARLQGRRPDRYIAVPAQEHLRTGRQCWAY